MLFRFHRDPPSQHQHQHQHGHGGDTNSFAGMGPQMMHPTMGSQGSQQQQQQQGGEHGHGQG